MRVPFEFNSYDEVQIKGYKWLKTGGTKEESTVLPKAIVIIAHGMAETILRYDTFAEFLLTKNLVSYGYSHRGHFETAGTLDNLGYIGEDGFEKMAEDLNSVIALAKSEFPNTPVFVFGHSMGSFVSRLYLLGHPDEVEGIILSGTGYTKKLDLQAAVLVAKLERLLKGSDRPSKLLDKLSFGSFNQSFKPNRTTFDWLSSEDTQVDQYIENPWCGNIHPASFFESMAKALLKVMYQSKPKPKKVVPMYVMSGALDPVGQMGEGVRKSAEFYRDAGYEVELKLYQGGRHEMLNEVNRQEVFEDIYNWLEARLRRS
jgi:alpha-beta hydrolase superfamily lysophospholipase